MNKYLLSFFFIVFIFFCSFAQNLKIDSLNNSFHKLSQQKEYDSALVILNQIIALEADNFLAHSNKVRIYVKLKDYNQAIKESLLLTVLKPDLAEGYLFTGMLYDKTSDTKNAKKQYKKAIAIFNSRISDPDKVGDLSANNLNKAITLILVGKVKKGHSEIQLLIEQEPENHMLSHFKDITREEILGQLIK
jgi:tetratricopeptide (TPR) repeat protein